MSASRRDFLKGAFAAAACTPSIACSAAEPPRLEVRELSLPVGAETPFSLLHVSDSHVARVNGTEPMSVLGFLHSRVKGRELGEHYLEEAVRYARERGVRLVHSGDLMEVSTSANLEYARRFMTNREVSVALGNHEFWRDRVTWDDSVRAEMLPILKEVFPRSAPAYLETRAGVSFLTIDDALERVSPEVVAAFEDAVRKGAPIVIVCHVPFPCTELERAHKGALLGSDGDRLTTEFVERVRREPLVRAILAGHLHVHRLVRFSPTALECVSAPLFHGQAQLITLTK